MKCPFRRRRTSRFFRRGGLTYSGRIYRFFKESLLNFIFYEIIRCPFRQRRNPLKNHQVQTLILAPVKMKSNPNLPRWTRIFRSREESEGAGFFVFSNIRMMGYFRLGYVKVIECPAVLEPPAGSRNRRNCENTKKTDNFRFFTWLEFSNISRSRRRTSFVR